MNILFSDPNWLDWNESLKKLTNYNVHIETFNNIELILKYIKDNKINIIIPCRPEAMFFVIENYDLLSRYNTHIICNNNKNIIKLLDDKCDFYIYMLDNNLG